MYNTPGFENFGEQTWEQFGAIAAVMGVFLVIIVLIILALAILQIIGMYKLLKKGGEHPAGAFVPLVGEYQMMRLTGMNPWWLVIIAYISILNIVPLLGSLCVLVAAIYFFVIFNIGIAKSYGKDSTGFIVGLVLLHPIFIFILGIKEDTKYVGVKPSKDILFNKEGVAPTK